MCVSSIIIENNAYQGISISIAGSVHERNFDFLKLKKILTRSSELLYHVTKKRSYFGEFVVILPSSWTGGACDDFTNVAPSKIDVHYTDRTDVQTLTTKHSKKCAEEGDIVYMPLNWLKGDTEDLAQQFVKQWSIYRYGVFEEEPIRKGLCFMSKNTWSPAGCYDLQVAVEPIFDDGVPFCTMPDEFLEKKSFKSSLMSYSNSSEILNFCDGSDSFPHNPSIPTLHNNLCEGKTVWSVIESSEDFKFGRNRPLNMDKSSHPSFKCFKDRSIQVTFAIQNSTVGKDLEPVMFELGYSLYQFLSNTLPPETKANVVMFSDREDQTEPVELDLTDSKLKDIIRHYVRTLNPVSNTCFRCGLEKALNASQAHTHPSPVVVLIAWESSLLSEKPSQLVESVRSFLLYKVRLQLILVDDTDTEAPPSGLVDAVRTTGGNIYSLPKEPVFMVSKLQVLLAGVVRNYLKVEDNIVVVHEAVYNNITQSFIDSFSTPNNMAVEKLVYNMYCDLGRNVQEKNPNCTVGKYSTTFKCGEVRNFNNQLHNSNSLTNAVHWEYPFEYQGGTTLPNCSSVAMLVVSPSSKEKLTLRGWLNNYKIAMSQNALIIYAEIAGSAEERVSVFATVSSSALISPITIELLDNGNGDPDVKGGDGIYSRYFSAFSKKGTYVVSISTETLNEGNTYFTESGQEKKASKLVQKKNIGSFSVLDDIPDIDIIPPNRIADLSVSSIDHENNTATLQWTAPGNDYDSGKATAYEIKYSENPASLSEKYFSTIENQPLTSSIPIEAGTKEIFEFHFPKINNGSLIYVALRAVDSNNNKGYISNIIQVYFNHSQIFETTSTAASSLGSTDSSILPEQANHTTENSNVTHTENPVSLETTTSETETPDTDILFDKKFIIVLSTSGGILLAIIFVNILVCCLCIKKRKQQQPDKKKLCKNMSLRPPHNLNIAYQDETNSQTDNNAEILNLQDESPYNKFSERNKARERYTYHTNKSLQNAEKSPTNSELGFRVVQTLPAYATSSLTRFTVKLNNLDAENEPVTKSSTELSQNTSNIDEDDDAPTAYEVHFAEDWKDLQDSMLSKITSKTLESQDINQPKPSGTLEKASFKLPRNELIVEIYYIVVQGVDSSQNKGKVSNIVQVVIGEQDSEFRNVTDKFVIENDTETSTDSIDESNEEVITLAKCYYILGGLAAGIFLILIINILIWCLCFKKYKIRWKALQDSISEKENSTSVKDLARSIPKDETAQYSYANPMMNRGNRAEDQNGIEPQEACSNTSVEYAQVVKREKKNKGIYQMEQIGNRENVRYSERDLGLV
ncbi:hypothetical protein JTE90_013260 [Oedothorax gibbosus]|uniref:Calcium-activated chloride channel N-terminal domain-containing protein n=1 Tax=Oedothorax gibbosus TaxID=931172 RepID=A0AAV6VFU1_9ARAC|nr:hypothetical protein JTE90_013260 [Oedothorax gibbosus]